MTLSEPDGARRVAAWTERIVPHHEYRAAARSGIHGGVDQELLEPLEVEFQRRGRGAAAEDWHQVDLIPDSAEIADEQHVLERVEPSHRGGIGNALAVDRMVVQLHAEIARRTLERPQRHDGQIHLGIGMANHAAGKSSILS